MNSRESKASFHRSLKRKVDEDLDKIDKLLCSDSDSSCDLDSICPFPSTSNTQFELSHQPSFINDLVNSSAACKNLNTLSCEVQGTCDGESSVISSGKDFGIISEVISDCDYSSDGNVVDSENGLGEFSCESDCEHCSASNLGSVQTFLETSFTGRAEAGQTLLGNDSRSSVESELRNQLRQWAISFNISNTALRGLLKTLQPLHEDLPKDPRTLLGNSKIGVVEKMGNGEYYNFGVAATLTQICENGALQSPLRLSFNVDGLPLFHSTSLQLWPILCLIQGSDIPPFPCAVWCGPGKPPRDSYFKDFVPDLKELQDNGLNVKDKHFKVETRSFICDAPAKAFCLGSVGHNAYYGCEKCIQKGLWVGRVNFPSCGAPLRTDQSFLDLAQKQHHKEVSPLIELGLGMVSGFPLDYLHLICLGVVRRLLKFMIEGKVDVVETSKTTSTNQSNDDLSDEEPSGKKKTRLRKKLLRGDDFNRVNKEIATVASFWPRDFSRPPRSLIEVKKFKGAENRNLLKYLAPVIFKKSIPHEYYVHWLLLHVAITILSSENLYRENIDVARKILVEFVKSSSKLYGEGFVVYNVHNLVHLPDNCRNHGKLDNFSAFPFENELCVIKHSIRGHFKPLHQLINRVHERAGVVSHKPRSDSFPDGVDGLKKMGPTAGLSGQCFRRLNFKGRTISLLAGDNAVALTNGAVILASNFVVTSDNTYVIGKRFLNYEDLYDYPIPSSDLGIYRVSKLSHRIQKWPMTDLKTKVVAVTIRQNDSYAVYPLTN